MWCLVEIGKLFKSELLNDTKVSLNAFVEFGIKLYNTYGGGLYINSAQPFDECLEINRLIRIISEFGAGNIKTKHFINKDSTASVLQHLFKLIGIKNVDSLKNCNIDGGDVWTDPYSVIIRQFLLKYDVQSENLMFFKRKYLKKVIMTHHYSVSY